MLNDHSCNNCRPNQPSGSFFFLICDRYCCWGKPFWWFEGSLLLHPQGDLKQTFSKMYTFLFPRAHCLPLLARMWPICTLVFRCVGIFYHSGLTFFFFFRLALCLPTKQVVWRRSTSSSTTRVAWIANVIPQSIVSIVVNLSTFQNGLIARMKQVPWETNTKSFLRWEHNWWSIIFYMSLSYNICSSDKSGRPVGSGRKFDRIRRSLRQLGHRGDRQ